MTTLAIIATAFIAVWLTLNIMAFMLLLWSVEPEIAHALALADLLHLPDDTMFVPAVVAAMATPTRLDDQASLAYTAKLACMAGYGKLTADQGHS